MLSVQHKAPLYTASAITLMIADILISVVNDTGELTFRASTVMGALLTGSLVSGIERRTASAQQAALKGCAAALLVALPYPVLGTLAGLATLIWARASGTLRDSY